MAKNTPTEGDLLILFDNLYEVFTLDLDGEVWIVSDSMVQFVDVSAVTGMALVSRFTEYEFFTSDMYYKVESNRYYTYLQDFLFDYTKLKLTDLAKFMYDIQDDFTGDLFIARRIR
jgi:hypothetical protein